jgi:hypothetical protein
MALSADHFMERHEDETCDAKESDAKINSLHAMTSVPPYKERLHSRLVQVRAQAAVTVIVLLQNAGEPLGQIEGLFAGKDLRYIVAGDFVEIVMVVSKEELDEISGVSMRSSSTRRSGSRSSKLTTRSPWPSPASYVFISS